MRTRVVVLGAGFGGLELTTILSNASGNAIDIVLVDKGDAFVFGFSKLHVMFGRQLPAAVRTSVPGHRQARRTVFPDDRAVDRSDGSADRAILDAFAERGITFVKDQLVKSLDPRRKVAVLSDDTVSMANCSIHVGFWVFRDLARIVRARSGRPSSTSVGERRPTRRPRRRPLRGRRNRARQSTNC
jgi:hypothetical protein